MTPGEKLDHRYLLPASATLYAMSIIQSYQSNSEFYITLLMLVLATYLFFEGLNAIHHDKGGDKKTTSHKGSLVEQEQSSYEAYMNGGSIKQTSFEREQAAWEALTKMAEAGSSWQVIEGAAMKLGLMLNMASKSDLETLERIYGKDFYDPLKQEVKP